MGAPERIVRHLRLRAESETSVRSAALKLEDALRCASLPDVGQRLLLVRQLNLGRIGADASPQTLSLLLEERVAAMGGMWVHGAAPDAEHANFVFFSDALEARRELTLRMFGAASITAWFWPLAVPEFKTADDTRANVRSIAFAIAALPEAPAALPAWIAGMAASGLAPVLARMITPAEGEMLLRAARLTVHAPSTCDVSARRTELSRPVSRATDVNDVEAQQRETYDAGGTALPEWLQSLSDAGGVEAGMRPHTRSEHVRDVRRVIARDRKEMEQTLLVPPGDMPAPVFMDLEENSKGTQHSPASRQRKENRALSGEPTEGVVADAQPKSLSDQWSFLDAVPSAHGGLLFLLSVLQRFEYASWVDTLPEGVGEQIARQMLALVLQRLRAPQDDPAWTLAAVSPIEETRHLNVQASPVWRNTAFKAPLGSKTNELTSLVTRAHSTTTLAHVWLVACRRWLRRTARIGIASLVRRPAAIGLTLTHADIYFRLGDADMRVRRAGLDCDPGWVPWFGRVVRFHYRDDLL